MGLKWFGFESTFWDHFGDVDLCRTWWTLLTHNLGGGFKYFCIFTTIWGRWTHFDEHMFQRGWFNHQPDNLCLKCSRGFYRPVFRGQGHPSHIPFSWHVGFSGFFRTTPSPWAMKQMGDYMVVFRYRLGLKSYSCYVGDDFINHDIRIQSLKQLTHRIHGRFIPVHEWVILMSFHVGKYAVRPMDPAGWSESIRLFVFLFFRGSPLTTATTSTTTTTTTTTPPPPTPPTPPPLTARFLHGTFQFDHSCDVIHSDRRNKAFSGTLRSLNGTNFGTTRWVLHGVKEGAPINGQNTVTGVKFHTLLIEVISRQFWYGPTLQK